MGQSVDRSRVKVELGSTVFLLVGGQSPRYVYGKVDGRNGPREDAYYEVAFEEQALAECSEVKLYFRAEGSFWCQNCVATRRQKLSTGQLITFKPKGKPRKEEHRKVDRSDAHLSGVTASVDGARECIVINVGDNGIAVVTHETHRVGAAVQVEVKWNAEVWVGPMVVKHVKEDERGARTYGLQCSDVGQCETLREGLRRIHATVMFQQGVLDEMMGSKD